MNHDIHCVSFQSSIKSLIGYSLEEFANLLENLASHLKRKFPKCGLIRFAGEIWLYYEQQFYVKITLFITAI